MINIDDFIKAEGGGYQRFTIASSVGFDLAPALGVFNPSGTAVGSMTSTRSGANTHYYGDVMMPNSIGFYYFSWSYGVNSYDMISRGVMEVVQTDVDVVDLYCDANEVREMYEPLSKGDLQNDRIDVFIRDVMNEVNARIGHKYSVPFFTGVSSFPPVIGTITKNLTLVNLVERKGGAEIPEWISERKEKFEGMLGNIADGEMFLVLSGGDLLEPVVNATVAQVDHSMEDYVPTFNMLDDHDQRIDPDRLDDEEDAL